MKYVIKKNSVTWTYKGEKVLVEACGTESIRVRASFCNEIVDENYNLKSLESVTSEIKETEDTVSIFCGKLEARIQDYGRNRTYKGYEEWMSWLLRDGTSGKN